MRRNLLLPLQGGPLDEGPPTGAPPFAWKLLGGCGVYRGLVCAPRRRPLCVFLCPSSSFSLPPSSPTSSGSYFFLFSFAANRTASIPRLPDKPQIIQKHKTQMAVTRAARAAAQAAAAAAAAPAAAPVALAAAAAAAPPLDSHEQHTDRSQQTKTSAAKSRRTTTSSNSSSNSNSSSSNNNSSNSKSSSSNDVDSGATCNGGDNTLSRNPQRPDSSSSSSSSSRRSRSSSNKAASSSRNEDDSSSSSNTNDGSSSSNSSTASCLAGESSLSSTSTSSNSSSSSNSNSSNSSSGSGSMPRVSLSLLRRRPPSASADSCSDEQQQNQQQQQQQQQQVRLPAVFRGLSLAPQPLTSLFNPLEGGPPSSQTDQRRRPAFLDLTAAPGVVKVQPLTAAPATINTTSTTTSSGGLSRVGWGEGGASLLRDERKVAAAVAAGTGPPRVSDLLLEGGPRGNLLLPSVEPAELSKTEKKEKKAAQKKKLEKWFDMPLKEVSPQLLRELRLLQLRGHLTSKSFGGRSRGPLVPLQRVNRKDGGPPTHAAYIQEARIVGGGLRAVGSGSESQAAGTANRGPGRRGAGPRGGSLLHALLNDPEVNRWTKRKYREIQQNNKQGHSSSWAPRGNKQKKHKKA
ncbi:hypothetical protein Efla_000030 [Eimeria flavescens]